MMIFSDLHEANIPLEDFSFKKFMMKFRNHLLLLTFQFQRRQI